MISSLASFQKPIFPGNLEPRELLICEQQQVAASPSLISRYILHNPLLAAYIACMLCNIIQTEKLKRVEVLLASHDVDLCKQRQHNTICGNCNAKRSYK